MDAPPTINPDRPDGPPATSRRVFIATAGAVAAGGVAYLLHASNAGATTTATLWRLNADWGYPAGPKSVTSCRCSACHHHAANKVFFSENDAIDGRIHPCCVCQPESFVVPASTAAELMGSSINGTSVDRRTPGIEDVLAAAAVPTTTPPTTTPPTTTAPPSPATAAPGTAPTTTPSDPGTSNGGVVDDTESSPPRATDDGGVEAATTGVRASSSVQPVASSTTPSTLAFTGGGTLAPVGVAVLGLGAVLLRLGRRGAAPATTGPPVSAPESGETRSDT